MSNIRIIHLDDDPVMHMKTEVALAENPFNMVFEYVPVSQVRDFLAEFARAKQPECVLLDIMLDDHGTTGVEVLEKIREGGYQGIVIMLTTVAEPAVIAHCVECGATDFITKGLNEVELAYRITHSLKTQLYKNVGEPLKVSFVGNTAKQIQNRLKRLIDSSLRSVLVYGESGTGKEVVSYILQALLPHSTPFISVDCGSIPEELVESEFFGHKKGSFTGALQSKVGFFKEVDGGWLFMDEIANLSYSAQAALLRVLETGEVRPVGASASEMVNVRVIAATNVNLDQKVEEGAFRGDLLERLRSYEIYLPPLRERAMEERSEIFDALLHRLNTQSQRYSGKSGTCYQITSEVRTIFLSYDWRKGNIREMWHSLQASSVDSDDGLITVLNIPRALRKACLQLQQTESLPSFSVNAKVHDSEQRGASATLSGQPTKGFSLNKDLSLMKLRTSFACDIPLQEIMEEVEKAVINAALQRHADRSGVYKGLGISRSSLNQKRHKYGL